MTPRDGITLFLNGAAMGAANVIPGVSGGTIAFITGVYERLFRAIKSFDAAALRMVLKGDWRGFATHTDLAFLVVLFAGVAASILSLARLLEFLFCTYEALTLAFFFGLIIASIVLVGKQVRRWNPAVVAWLVLGTAVAVGLGLMKPAAQNDGFIYLMLCGVVAMASMVLPGLSGSYVLLIMGNYLLVIGAVSRLEVDILLPVAIGAALGLLAFSHLLSYVFQRFHDATVALLTGFVLGSLYIIWPWKTTVFRTDAAGHPVDKYGALVTDTCRDGIVLGYERFLPDTAAQWLPGLGLMVLGAGIVLLIERLGQDRTA